MTEQARSALERLVAEDPAAAMTPIRRHYPGGPAERLEVSIAEIAVRYAQEVEAADEAGLEPEACLAPIARFGHLYAG